MKNFLGNKVVSKDKRTLHPWDTAPDLKDEFACENIWSAGYLEEMSKRPFGFLIGMQTPCLKSPSFVEQCFSSPQKPTWECVYFSPKEVEEIPFLKQNIKSRPENPEWLNVKIDVRKLTEKANRLGLSGSEDDYVKALQLLAFKPTLE